MGGRAGNTTGQPLAAGQRGQSLRFLAGVVWRLRRAVVLWCARSRAISPGLVCVVIVASAGVLAAAQVSSAASSPATLTATPAGAAVGSVLSLTGSGMPARKTGTIWLGSVRVARFRVDRRGDWSVFVRVPSKTPVGTIRLRAAVGASAIAGSFAVTRSVIPGSSDTTISGLSTGQWVRVSPTRVRAGSSVRLDATGFRRHAVVQLWFAKRRLATWRTDRRGAVRGLFAVPATTPVAPYYLSVRSSGHRLNVRLVVTATSPGSGVSSHTGQPGASRGNAGQKEKPAGPGGQQELPEAPNTHAPAFAPASPPAKATEGETYSYMFAATGTPAPTFALVGAPSWLTIGSQSGELSGAPPSGSGGTSVTYSVIATNSQGTASAGPFTVQIAYAAPTIQQIPDQSIFRQVQITPIAPAITGKVTGFSESNLPAGLAFDTSTGMISGSPTRIGTGVATVTATGPGGTASTAFSWTVKDPVVDAVGDMACAFDDPNYNGGNGESPIQAPGNNCLQKYVSDLVVNPLPDAFLDLGDNQYNTGSLFDYQHVFDPTFGRANAVTYPSLGNAEYNDGSSPPTGFFSYFNSTNVSSRIQAHGGDVSHFSDGYYSFNLGTWHIIALNSNCVGTYGVGGGCAAGSPEEAWLSNDLKATTGKCILAYWHHPLFSELANEPAIKSFWADLYNEHATLVLNGHGDHHYERFAPQDPNGNAVANGISEFIVSTGGQSHGVVPSSTLSNSETADYKTFGVLRLTLHPGSYDWQFIPASDGQLWDGFKDSGSGSCS